MTRSTAFRRAARDDARSARDWYEDRRPGLGAAFVQRLEACIAQIERNPELGPVVDEDTRRVQLRRFPYVVYYEIVDDENLLVLAVWHGRRDPAGWTERPE